MRKLLLAGVFAAGLLAAMGWLASAVPAHGGPRHHLHHAVVHAPKDFHEWHPWEWRWTWRALDERRLMVS